MEGRRVGVLTKKGQSVQASPGIRRRRPATPAWAPGEGPAFVVQGPALTVAVEAVLGTGHPDPRHKRPQEGGVSVDAGTGWWAAQTGSGLLCFSVNRKSWMLPSQCPTVERTAWPFVPRGCLDKVLSRPMHPAQTTSDEQSRGRVHRQASLGSLRQRPQRNRPPLATILHVFCLDCVVFI